MAPKRALRKDGDTVTHDLENAAAPLEQVDLRPRVLRPNLGRQTGGPGFVVSDHAIANGDVHSEGTENGEHDNCILLAVPALLRLGRDPYPREIRQLFDGRVTLHHDLAERIELRLQIG